MHGPHTPRMRMVSGLARLCAQFRASTAGNFAIVFAAAAPLLLLAVGTAVDYALYANKTSRAQATADAAAIAGAKALSMADASRESIAAVVDAVVQSYMGKGATAHGDLGFASSTEVVNVPGQPMQVAVKLSGKSNSLFAAPFGLGDWTIEMSSVAEVVGTPNVCVLALDASAMGTIYLEKNARVIGQNCAVYSNSGHPNGIKAFNSSLLSAKMICTAGGRTGGSTNFDPDPLVDCPQFDDPLAGRPAPYVGPCVASNLIVDSQTVTLSPGTYCGGIRVTGTAAVTFEPGLYVMKDGPLIVDKTASIIGAGTGFYFSGQAATFRFDTDTTIDLTAPKEGPMAGLLFFGDRSQSNAPYAILSDHARQLLGTIYLPQGELTIDANQPIADQSAYTAIVARKLKASSGPTVMLNTNYDQTDVPVPAGIRGAGQAVSLVR